MRYLLTRITFIEMFCCELQQFIIKRGDGHDICHKNTVPVHRANSVSRTATINLQGGLNTEDDKAKMF